MFERTARFGLVALLVLCCAASPPPAATVSCANARLPRSILDGSSSGTLSDALPTIELRAPRATLHLAVADDEASRELGLMCVTRLRQHAGMLFPFARDANWEFWMKDTLIPLDMIWVARNGTVTALASNVPASTLQTPDDAVARRSGYGRYVIELRADEARRDGIVAGTKLALPPLGEYR
jgi:hypothetical protein